MSEKKPVWYRVTFIIKYNNKQYRFTKDCYASNKAQAREIVETAWYRHHTQHMFHIETFRMTKLAAMDNTFIHNFTES